ncbi:MAG: hypothetical protein QXO40_02345 [Candidatus Aenigmatarchaeota archaeon]
MVVSVIMDNKYFREYFKRRRAEGFPYKKAVLAVTPKLLRTIYGMLKHKKPLASVIAYHPVCKEMY